MEQKHLDEIDESYFGEEFVDEESVPEQAGEEDKFELKKELKESLSDKKSSLYPKSKNVVAKGNKKSVGKSGSDVDAEETDDVKITSLKDENQLKNEESVLKAAKVKVERASPPVDPWANDSHNSGFFKEISTWKAITGIVVILLLFSVLTNGFTFSKSAAGGKSISLADAEKKATEYVNTNLVQPPFLATVEKAVDAGNLYKITFSVAGQSVDSYMTKDGTLFFPVGYDPSVSLAVQGGAEASLDEAEGANSTVGEISTLGESDEIEVVGDVSKNAAVVLEEPEVRNEKAAAKKEVSINAKRWLFSPDMVIVEKGDTVTLTVNPQSLDFTFSIPELNVEKEVKGITTVEFTADKEGSFAFSCSSCEAWRGMAGVIVVK